MDEPTKTVKEALEDNWAGSDITLEPRKGDITFLRGHPPDLTARYRKGRISIEVYNLSKPAEQRSVGLVTFRHIVAVDIWQSIHPQTEERIDTLLNERQNIEDEIERIILLKNSLLTNINFAAIGGTLYQDEYMGDPPSLHAVKQVECLYYTHS